MDSVGRQVEKDCVCITEQGWHSSVAVVVVEVVVVPIMVADSVVVVVLLARLQA